MKSKKILKPRSSNAFILATVLVFCMTAMLLLVTLLPLIDHVKHLEATGRYSTELRTAADFGIDYSLQQLNIFADTYPGQLAPMVNTGPQVLPNSALTAFPNVRVTVKVQRISSADWLAFNSIGSTIYSPDLDLATGPYLVIESKAQRGMLSKTIRVFLEPTYNLPTSDASRNFGLTNKQSYFDIPLYSEKNLDRVSTLPNLDIQRGLGSLPTFPYTGAPPPNITLLTGDPKPVKERSPIPSPGITKNLNSAMDSQGNYSLTPGSYSTPSVDFVTPNSVSFDFSSSEAPVKIFVQDGSPSNSSSNAITINASAFRSSPSPESLQFWYSGNRPITLTLDADFSGIIYANKALVTLDGASNFNGAIVADQMTLNNTGEMKIITNLTDSGANSLATKNGLTRSVNGTGDPVTHGYKAVSWQDLSSAP